MNKVKLTVDETPHVSNNTKPVNEAEKKKNRFFNKFIRADQVEISSTKYLIKNWFGYEGLSMVYGSSGVGKTLLALDLAFHLAAGSDWFGNRVKQGSVVYIMSEGNNVSNNRIKAIEIEKSELFSKASHLFYCLNDIVSLYSVKKDTTDFIEEVKQFNPRLIIIDTLAMAMSGGDENRTQDITVVVENMKKIQQALSCHIMVLHHPGKDETRGARGSSALHAASDTVLELKKNKDVVCVRAVKQRDMEGDKELNFKIEKVVIGKDEDGDEVSSAVIDETGPMLGEKQEDVLRIVKSCRDFGISQIDIIQLLQNEGKSALAPNISRDLKKLEGRQLVVKKGSVYFPLV